MASRASAAAAAAAAGTAPLGAPTGTSTTGSHPYGTPPPAGTTSGTPAPDVSAFNEDEYFLAEQQATKAFDPNEVEWRRKTEEGIRTSGSSHVPGDPTRVKQLAAAGIASYVIRHKGFPFNKRFVKNERETLAAAHITDTLRRAGEDEQLLGSTDHGSFSPLVQQVIDKGSKKPPSTLKKKWQDRKKPPGSRFKPLKWVAFFAVLTWIYYHFFLREYPGIVSTLALWVLVGLVAAMLIFTLLKKSVSGFRITWVIVLVAALAINLLIATAVESTGAGKPTVVTPVSCPQQYSGCKQIPVNAVATGLNMLVKYGQNCRTNPALGSCATDFKWKQDANSTARVLDQMDWTAVGTQPYLLCVTDKQLPDIGAPRLLTKWCS